MLISIGNAAKRLGVSVSTLRSWERSGYLIPKCRTKGQDRRYHLDELDGLNSLNSKKSNKITVAYGRVSSFDQREDLERQKETLLKYLNDSQETSFQLISDTSY